MRNTHNESLQTKELPLPERIEHETGEHSATNDLLLLNALLNDIPNYIYFKDTNSRFIRISKSHAKALGVSNPSEAIGKSDFDFFSQEHADQAYRDEQQIMQTGEPLTKEEKETWPDRPDTWAITSKMPLRDKDGRIIGTFGISKDITEEKYLRENIEDLQKDVGRTFHTLSATLLLVTHAIMPTLNALSPDPFREKLLPSTELIWNELAGFRNSLTSTMRKLLESVGTPLQKDALPEEEWAELDKLVSQIEEVEKINIAEQRAPLLRLVARRVIDIIGNIKKSSLRQELIREVRRSAEQLERITCLIALHQANDRILDTDYMVRDLRERVLTGIKKNEESKIYEFWDLVKEAIEGLSEYASHKGIELRKDNRSEKACVLAGRRAVIRAVNNLLHNAIKYSWWRGLDVKPWIEIRSCIRGNQVCVEIEDYGVPIPRDEIEEGLIFQMGWRGRLSSQRGRIGTGIGLADARDVAQRYGGDVKITSRPASYYASKDDITVPHIKTALLSLPIHH